MSPGWSTPTTPLTTSATNVGDTVGDTATAPVATVDAQGDFEMAFADDIVIDGTANPISGTTLQIENPVLFGRVVGADVTCAGLGGLAMPIGVTFDPSVDVCLFTEIGVGGALPPTPSADAFVCE